MLSVSTQDIRQQRLLCKPRHCTWMLWIQTLQLPIKAADPLGMMLDLSVADTTLPRIWLDCTWHGYNETGSWKRRSLTTSSSSNSSRIVGNNATLIHRLMIWWWLAPFVTKWILGTYSCELHHQLSWFVELQKIYMSNYMSDIAIVVNWERVVVICQRPLALISVL